MRPFLLCLLLVLACAFPPARAARNVIQANPAKPGLISLDIQDLTFGQVVSLFEQHSRAVIIFDSSVLTGRVEAVLNNVDWKDALGSIAETFDHRLVESGPNVYQIVRPTITGEPAIPVAPAPAPEVPAPPAARTVVTANTTTVVEPVPSEEPAALQPVVAPPAPQPSPEAPPAPTAGLERLRDPEFAAACAAFDRNYLNALRKQGFSEKEAFQLLLRANPAGLK
jgi:hypothetical protein